MLRHLSTVFILLTAIPAGAQTITGCGSAFAAPLYQKWSQEYKAQTGVTINYEPIGSTGGIKNITAHTCDFGASDVPMNDAQMSAAPGIVHIPTVIQTVAIVYNLPGMTSTLHLTGPIIADIYLGVITRWNDPRLLKINPGVPLSNMAIFPVHGSYSSGATYDFTTYLCTVSPSWRDSVGSGPSVHWPVGLGGKGEQVHMIKIHDGGFGYVDLNYAFTNQIPFAAIQNSKGNFVLPTVQSAMEAAQAVKMPPDLRGGIVNSPIPNGYPIVGFTYLLAYRGHTQPEVKDFLTWCLTTGQKDAAEMLYAPLPPNVQKRALALVNGLK